MTNAFDTSGHRGRRHDKLCSSGKPSEILPMPADSYSDLTSVPQLFSQEESDAPVLPAGAALSRSGSLSYQPVHTGIGSSHTRAKLPKVDTSIASPVEGVERINLNDEAFDSPEKSAGSSRAFLPPGAASPNVAVSPRNMNREFAPPPLPPRRAADVGSMHTRRPSYNATSPQGHADEMCGTTYEPPSPATTTMTSPGTNLGHSTIREDVPMDMHDQLM